MGAEVEAAGGDAGHGTAMNALPPACRHPRHDAQVVATGTANRSERACPPGHSARRMLRGKVWWCGVAAESRQRGAQRLLRAHATRAGEGTKAACKQLVGTLEWEGGAGEGGRQGRGIEERAGGPELARCTHEGS